MAAETKRAPHARCLFSRVIQGVRLRRRARVHASSKCPPNQPTHPPSGRPSLMHNAALHIPDANINNVGSVESGSGCDQRVKTLMAALGS